MPGLCDVDPQHDTFPKLLLRNARIRGARPAMREKDLGIWQTWTWDEAARNVRAIARGLAAAGLQRGERIAIVGDNRPRLYWSIAAAQSLGAVPVPVYQDSVATEMRFVLDHAEVRFAVAEDQEQVDKLLSLMAECPRLETIVYDDARGLRHYARPCLLAMDALAGDGAARDAADPAWLDGEIAKGAADDTAIILYTSGTTGEPKGVVLSHRNIYVTNMNVALAEGLDEKAETLAYLPMAWVGDHAFSYAQSIAVGFCVACPESADTVLTDLRELGPTYFFAPPRIFESILTTVMIRMADAGAVKRWAFDRFMRLARRVGTRLIDGQAVAPHDRLLYRLGELLVYGPLKNTLGLSRVRIAYTAGEAIGPDIFDFYRSLGINLKQLYGSTEASVFITVQPNGEIRSDTVGRPAPGVEIRLADNGEVLFRSPGVFREYWKNPEATAKTRDAEGWVHTGDAGVFGADGHLRIVDRARDVGRLADGTLFAPKFIENKLKFFPHIKEAVAFGDGRDAVCCFLNIDMPAVGSWAERRGLAYASYQELAALPAVAGLLADEVRQVNRDLAAEPALAGARIRRFLVLPKELDADDGELTRTRKVRRGFIAERYAPLVEALYSGAGRATISTEVTYEDGRKGHLAAEVVVHAVTDEAPLAEAAE
ncbi:MAG: long-chain fatty acid--CoA ligase [Alphaproteobacteria bacterium]